MDLTFDSTALTVLETLGYRYFCCKEEWHPRDAEDDMFIYYELVPFTSQLEAMNYYYDCVLSGTKCHVFVEEDSINELARGIPGLKVHIKAAETVFAS